MVKAADCGIVLSEFVLHGKSIYNIIPLLKIKNVQLILYFKNKNISLFSQSQKYVHTNIPEIFGKNKSATEETNNK